MKTKKKKMSDYFLPKPVSQSKPPRPDILLLALGSGLISAATRSQPEVHMGTRLVHNQAGSGQGHTGRSSSREGSCPSAEYKLPQEMCAASWSLAHLRNQKDCTPGLYLCTRRPRLISVTTHIQAATRWGWEHAHICCSRLMAISSTTPGTQYCFLEFYPPKQKREKGKYTPYSIISKWQKKDMCQCPPMEA